jgi:ribose transport system permease protein
MKPPKTTAGDDLPPEDPTLEQTPKATRPQGLMRQEERVARRSGGVAVLSRHAVGVVALVLVALFGIMNTQTFLNLSNLQLVVGSNSVSLILALGAVMPLIAGEFDLSIGYTLELATVVTAVLSEHHVGIFLSLLIVVAMGAGIGLVNRFITTLGVGTVLSAVSLEMTNGEILINGIPHSLVNFAQNNVAGIPKIVLPAAVCFLALWVVCEKTTYGRRLLAVGLSPRASQLSGVPVGRMLGSSFVIAGVLAAVAGWLELGRVGSASAGVGPDFLLPAIAAGFLGATTIKPGRFNVLGTGVAVALVAIGVNGLELNGAADWVQPLFDGGVLLLAVGSAQLLARRAR